MSDVVKLETEMWELCEMYRDYVTKYLNSLNILASAVATQDAGLVPEANNLVNEAGDIVIDYM